jgi:hypothetical protein
VKEIYFDDHEWVVRYLIADTGTWLSGRRVLISPFALREVDLENGIIHVQLTREQIEKSPSIHADKPVSRQFEIEYYKYYGWPMYWDGPALWGPTPVPAWYGHGGGPVETRSRLKEEGDPNLRSSAEVTGYYIHAKDGEIGHVDDILVDDENWVIRYLVIDTRNWLPGKRVLISPEWIERVSWEDSMVYTGLHRETIQNAPDFDEAAQVGRDYESRLHEHYSREAYWIREADHTTARDK